MTPEIESDVSLSSERDDEHRKASAKRKPTRRPAHRTRHKAEHFAKQKGSKGLLLQLSKKAKLFHSPDKTGWAEIRVGTRKEAVRVDSAEFHDWLTRAYYSQTQHAPNTTEMEAAIKTLAAQAKFEGKVRNVGLRVARNGNAILIDLANDKGEIVQIDAKGWSIVTESPVVFEHPAGMLPLPRPTQGGNFQVLREFVNAESEQDFATIGGWVASAFHPEGPYPILCLEGSQGSGKTTLTRFLRSLVDPNTVPARSLAKDERDLQIAAQRNRMLAFDNVSGLTDLRSDQLCRMATGSGFATRKLYSDLEEVRFNGSRPILLNTIAELTARPDFLDRVFWVKLKSLADGGRETESDLQAKFERARPEIFGGICTALSAAFRNSASVPSEGLPRMIDSAKWAIASEQSLGFREGTMRKVLSDNAQKTTAWATEGNPIIDGLRKLLQPGEEWTGTATELYEELAIVTADVVQKSATFPKSAIALAAHFHRLEETLPGCGFRVEFGRIAERRSIKIHRIETIAGDPECGSRSDANDADDGNSQLLSVSEKQIEEKGGRTVP